MEIGSGVYSIQPVSNYFQDPPGTGRRAHTRQDPPETTTRSANNGPVSNQDPGQAVEVQKLKAVEAAVRAHETAHTAVGGGLAGSITYNYTIGPDGKRYITGGEVSISMPGGGTPEETIRNMGRVIAAALAPANPSAQDSAVAARAAAIQNQARQQAAAEAAKDAVVVEDGEPVALLPATANPSEVEGPDLTGEETGPLALVSQRPASEVKEEWEERLKAYFAKPNIPTLSVYA